jgi:hypothetical protein
VLGSESKERGAKEIPWSRCLEVDKGFCAADTRAGAEGSWGKSMF